MVSATKNKYKFYRINVPSKHKNINIEQEVEKLLKDNEDLERFNYYVTVFYGGKEASDYQNIYEEQ